MSARDDVVPGVPVPPEPFHPPRGFGESGAAGEARPPEGRHLYAPVVTAHFPAVAAAEAAATSLAELPWLEPRAIQLFQKEASDLDPEEALGGDLAATLYRFFQGEPPVDSGNDPGLAPGEAALIVQVATMAQAEAVLRHLEPLKPLHAHAYPAQDIAAQDAERSDHP